MLIGETPIGDQPGIGDSFIVREKAYTMDEWIIFAGSEPIEDPPGTIRYSMNRLSDVLLKKTLISEPDFDVVIGRNAILATYSMDIGLLKALSSVDFDIILRPTYDATIPSTSVIDAIVWSYATMLDGVWRQMETMSNALKLEHAMGTDLDVAWGQIYDLPRTYGEDDTDYRDRLKTRTSIIKSSGTKESCETIIDSILGENITEITSRYPGTVDISFGTDENMRIAKSRKNLLDVLIPQMLAAGISYNLLLPILDYYMDTLMLGPLNVHINSDMMLCHEDTDFTYEMDFESIFITTLGINIDSVLMKIYERYLVINPIIQKPMDEDLSIDSIIKILKTKSLEAILSFKSTYNRYLNNDILIHKHDILKYYDMGLIEIGTKRRFLRIASEFVFQPISAIDIDIWIRLLQANLDTDILLKRGYPKKHGMTIELVGA